MSIAEILEQAQALSPRERKQLAVLLVSSLDVMDETIPPKRKTGAEIAAKLEAIGPIELLYPDIDDPVEWVEQLRRN